ncbi:MAG: TolC family protein [Pseudomonadota bacterium]
MSLPSSLRRAASPSSLRLLPLTAVVLATLGGCAVAPEPITVAERSTRAKEDVATLFKDMEPIAGDVTLHEAFARALKYNYDYRLRSMERSMADAQLDVAKYDMLPSLTVSAGYSSRSNDAGARSVDLATGIESNLFSGAQERTGNRQNAVLAWNVLDFGVSYVRAQQQANQVLIAEERKRKVVQNISQDVRQAFWRAYVAQQTLPRMDVLLGRLKEALARSGRMEQEKMMPPMQALAYQRALLDMHSQVVMRRQELVLAKSELNALINLRPGTEIRLAAADLEAPAAALHRLDDLDALDQAALNNRPELREEDYRKKITVLDGRKALLGFLPGLEFNLSHNRDSNKFLLNNSWSEAGGLVSLNLLRAFSYPSAMKAQETSLQLGDTRRVALTMAVLTQVRIAAQRYQEAQADYQISQQGAEVDTRIEKLMAAGIKASSENEMELLRVQVKSALSDMQRYMALANVQIAYARVANSVGADLLPDVPQTQSVKAFTAQLAAADLQWRKTNFNTARAVPVALNVGVAPIVAPAGSGIDLSNMMRTRLAALGVAPGTASDGGATIGATIEVGQPRAGMRSVEMLWTIKRNGATLASVPYRSVIPESVPNAWSVFGEAATEMAANQLVAALRNEPAGEASRSTAKGGSN